MLDSRAGKDDGRILFTAESRPCLRHIVGNDQVEALRRELVGRMLNEVLRFGGEADQDLGGPFGREHGQDIGGPLQLKRRNGSGSLFQLL